VRSAVRVLIVDDEPLARLRLRQLLAQCSDPGAQVEGEAGHARQAFELIGRTAIDLVLLDIRMPGEDGLQLAARLQALPRPPATVFVTAHDAHALQAFELQALDYLSKPVQLPRLQQVLRRVAGDRSTAVAAAPPSADAAQDAPVLVISERQRTLRIPLAEIVMARASQKLVSLRTLTREHLLDESLAELEQRLGPGFIRVHRNALVARHAARELVRRAGQNAEDGWFLRVMPGEHWVPVSRRLVATVREALAAR
jgi:two-component system, LytTR family, response regulator AlgR